MKCEICNVDVHKASFVKLPQSKRHLEIEKKEMIILKRLFEEAIENKIKNLILNH